MILGLGGCSTCQRTVPIVRENESKDDSPLVCLEHLDSVGRTCEGSNMTPEGLCRKIPQTWHMVDLSPMTGFSVVRLTFTDGGCINQEHIRDGFSFQRASAIVGQRNHREPHFAVYHGGERTAGFSVVEQTMFGPDPEWHWDYQQEKLVRDNMTQDEAMSLAQLLNRLAHPHFAPGWCTAT